jgi:K+-sensing histidine kinase KdpD
MWNLRSTVPIVAALAIVSVVTAVLWLIKLGATGPQHLVFFYLLPTALVAMFYGGLPAVLCTLTATACATFFLYDPIYSFEVSSTRDVGELVCFTGLALLGAKSAAELLRPVAKIPQR